MMRTMTGVTRILEVIRRGVVDEASAQFANSAVTLLPSF